MRTRFRHIQGRRVLETRALKRGIIAVERDRLSALAGSAWCRDCRASMFLESLQQHAQSSPCQCRRAIRCSSMCLPALDPQGRATGVWVSVMVARGGKPHNSSVSVRRLNRRQRLAACVRREFNVATKRTALLRRERIGTGSGAFDTRAGPLPREMQLYGQIYYM